MSKGNEGSAQAGGTRRQSNKSQRVRRTVSLTKREITGKKGPLIYLIIFYIENIWRFQIKVLTLHRDSEMSRP